MVEEIVRSVVQLLPVVLPQLTGAEMRLLLQRVSRVVPQIPQSFTVVLYRVVMFVHCSGAVLKRVAEAEVHVASKFYDLDSRFMGFIMRWTDHVSGRRDTGWCVAHVVVVPHVVSCCNTKEPHPLSDEVLSLLRLCK